MTTPPRPRGRPRRGIEVASATVIVRLEPADMARLRAAAAEAGMPPATLVHQMVVRALDAGDWRG